MKHIRTSVFIGICVVMCACGVMTKPSVSKNNSQTPSYPAELMPRFLYLEAAKTYRILNDPKTAEKLLQRSLALDSTADAPYYELSLIYGNNPERAMSYILKASEIDSTNIWYKYQMGDLLVKQKKYPQALAVYENIMKLSPNNPEIFRYTAALYEQINMPFAALSLLDSAETKFGKQEELSAYKRELLIKLHLYDRAIQEAVALAESNPYEIKHLVILAELYAGSGKDSLALDAFERARALDPEDFNLLMSLNNYYLTKKDNINFLKTTQKLFISEQLPIENKIKFFNEIIKSPTYYTENYFWVNDVASSLYYTHPKDEKVRELYATHLINSGRIEDALKFYKSLLAEPQTTPKNYNQILDIEIYLQHPDSVERYAEQALKLFPRNVEIMQRKVYSLTTQNKNQEALKTLKTSLKYTKSDSVRSVIYGTMGDIANTAKMPYAKYYDKALALDSTNVLVLNNYSYFLAQKGEQLDKALAMAEKMVTMAENNPTYLDTYAWVLFKNGKAEEAKKVMRQAISLDTRNSSELLLHYGDILFELNETYMASVYWKKALEAGADAKLIEQRLKKLNK